MIRKIFELEDQLAASKTQEEITLSNAVSEKHRFDDWKETERSSFEAIYGNLRHELETAGKGKR